MSSEFTRKIVGHAFPQGFVQRIKKRLTVNCQPPENLPKHVRRLLLRSSLLCSLLCSLLHSWLCGCSLLRGLLCSFLCHSSFLQKKIELERPSCRSLPGLEYSGQPRTKTSDHQHPLMLIMQIPCLPDDRCEVRFERRYPSPRATRT